MSESKPLTDADLDRMYNDPEHWESLRVATARHLADFEAPSRSRESAQAGPPAEVTDADKEYVRGLYRHRITLSECCLRMLATGTHIPIALGYQAAAPGIVRAGNEA